MSGNAAGFRELAGSARRVRKGAVRAAPADPNETMTVSIYVRRPPNAPPLLDQSHYAARPLGRRAHMSRAELATGQGAAAEDLKAVTDFAAARGLAIVETSPARRLVRVSGTLAQLASAFSVELFQYKSPTETYRGHEGPVRLPAEIADVVEGVFGLDNRRMARRAGGGGGAVPLTPPQVAQAYNFPSPPGGAAGQTVAVLEFSGPISQGLSTAGFAQSDIDSYINYLNSTTGSSLTSTNVIAVAIDESADAPGDVPGGSAANFNISTDNDVEVTLDLEIIVSVAQGAKVVAYFAPSTEQGWVDAITAIVADTTHEPSVLSISWGWAELESQAFQDSNPENFSFEWTQQAFNQMTTAFQDAANIGMTVFVASGDAGSDCLVDDGAAHVIYPSSDPWVTSCGGTLINSISPLVEDTWNDNALGGGATGGGVSYLAGKPSWQASAGVPVSVNPDHHVGRGLPDVAGNASPNSGYLLWLYGTSSDKLLITAPPFAAGSPLGPVGGTSAVGPLYASLIALINASLDTRVGYLNPTLYALGGSGVFRDINDGINNSVTTNSGATSPGYVSGPGWDACTGWGVVDGTQLLSALQPVFQKTVTLVIERSTYGKDEVTTLLVGGETTYTDVVYVQADGFFAAQFGLNSGNLSNPPMLSTLLTFSGSFTGLSTSGVTLVFDTSTGVQLEDPTDFLGVQRITFPFNVQFATIGGTLQAFNGVPASPGYQDFGLAATVKTIASGGSPSVTATSSTAEIQFVLQADPYMVAGETWYVSNDMRVFTVTPATLQPNQAPLPYSTTQWGPDPNTYITNLINELNTNFTDPTVQNTPFNAVPYGEDQSALMLSQLDMAMNPVFNFGLARLHLQGDTANNVRTFFRLFISSSPDTDFNQNTTFRSLPQTDSMGNTIPGTLIPLLGFPTNDMTSTIPFFAAGRIDSTSEDMTRQSDPANVQTIPSPLIPSPPPPGSEVLAYFGCWLDLNQPTAQFPLDPATASTPNGPWQLSEIQSIPAIIMSNHACLVAEIAYDPDPIPPGANATTSDKIGQRNLSWGGSDNPGPQSAHRVPTLFDVRRTTAALPQSLLPDELMIEWGNVPVGSIASIYWPGVSADEVLGLASRFYGTGQLKKLDSNTIQCVTGAITYIPVPAGTGPSLAGLLTVDLPQTVRAGEQFRVVVRRLAWRYTDVYAAGKRDARNWRYVVGAFQMNIPVSTSKTLLPVEESILAVYKWKIEQIPTSNRWYPVLRRYIAQISDVVSGLGGKPGEIQPSQTGGVIVRQPEPEKPVEYTGKVMGLAFDRFGDFEGFLFLTEAGVEMSFLAREQAIEERVREAWGDRMVVSVFVEPSDPRRPVLIILRRAPRRWGAEEMVR